MTVAFYFGDKSSRWFLLPPPKFLPHSGHSTMSVVRRKAAPSRASIFARARVCSRVILNGQIGRGAGVARAWRGREAGVVDTTDTTQLEV